MSANAGWERLKSLFKQAIEQPAAARDAWLERECAAQPELLARLRALLAARDDAPRMLENGAATLLQELIPDDPDAAADGAAQLGPYRIVTLLGEGGMGRVYLAERADGQFRRRVALKSVRAELVTPELTQRFLRERDTLARLVHPNVAALYDGGVDGRGAPYFTLELVEGEAITRWCDAHRLGLRARVELMLKVCDAVAYAHRNLVVHRDLKPSNILVARDGEPKLLDFGIAKLLGGEGDGTEQTDTRARPMTREYAAPEQILGEAVTTATDVHALGVLLYLLLCGRMPYRRAALGQSGWPKAILEEAPEPMERAVGRTPARTSGPPVDPPHASSGADAVEIAEARSLSPQALRRLLRGDLERIVQRALAKSPEARYATVTALAADLQAWLRHRAISGGTRSYRMRKFARRHWLPLGAAALLLAVVVGGALLAAADARKIAREAQTTAAVRNFLLDLFRNANPNATGGKTVTLREAVDRGAERLAKIPADQVALRAEVGATLGTIYYQLGDHRKAAELHAAAFATAKDDPASALLAARAERFEATDRASLGENTRAQAMADDAVARMRRITPLPVLELARALETAGWIAGKRADMKEAARLSAEGLALASQPGIDPEVTLLALEQSGNVARLRFQYDAAADYYRRALEVSSKLYGADEQNTIGIEHMYGTVLSDLSRFAEADAHLEAAWRSSSRVFGEASGRTLRIGEMLGINDLQWGHITSARDRYARMLALVEAAVPRNDEVVAEIRLNYAEILAQLRQFGQAEPLLASVRDFLRAHAGSPPPEIAEALNGLAGVHMETGGLEAAEGEERAALALLEPVGFEDTSSERGRLCRILLRRGNVDAALAMGRQAVDNALEVYGERSHNAARAHYSYGVALAAAKRDGEAEAQFRAALKSYALLLPPDGMHPLSADVRFALGSLLLARGNAGAEGARMLRQSVQLRTAYLGADAEPTREASALLARLGAGNGAVADHR